MKEQKKVVCIIVAIIIIIGVVICKTKGFNIAFEYMNRQQIVLTNGTGLDISKVQEIANSVIKNKKVKVQKIERFGNAIQIVSNTISEEEKEEIIAKVNEEYGIDISNDSISITNISNTRIVDVLKPYVLPGILTLVVVELYYIIMYHKLGLMKVLLKGICIPIVIQLMYFAVIAITRVPFGRVVNSIAIGIYMVSIAYVTICLQKEKERIKEKDEKEND